MNKQYKYIYGPVFSWRLGMSLGVDPLSAGSKVCNFDCLYCQLGKSERLIQQRQIFVPTKDILREIRAVQSGHIDHITFSGCGEPTLAENLGQLIEGVRQIRAEPIAVITNASLIHRLDVQKDLAQADFVLAKLDAASLDVFHQVNQPAEDVALDAIINGLTVFKKKFQGRLALQMMLIEPNQKDVKDLADLARKINPDEVQLNTPLRPCKTKPLTPQEISKMKKFFDGIRVLSVFDVKPKKYSPFDIKKTIHRHGEFQKSPG